MKSVKRRGATGRPVLYPVSVYDEIRAERGRQDEKWGVQAHPNGTGSALIIPIDPRGMAKDVADRARERCNRLTAAGQVTYEAILTEEIFEAYAEDLPEKLREELVQCGAVIVAWIQKIDRDKQRKNT